MKWFAVVNLLIIRALLVLSLIISSLLSYSVTGPIKIVRACPAKFNNDITITWKIPPDPCGSFRAYYIYGRANPSLTWSLIDSVNFYPTNQYTHANATSYKISGQYYIEVHYDCDFTSLLYSDTISVNKQPLAPVIDSVSVNIFTNEIIIGWAKVNQKDIAGYVVKDFDGTGFADLSFTQASYYLVGTGVADPQVKSFGYGIASSDSCTLESTISQPHQTIHLTATTNECYKSVSLSWNRYDGFSSSVGAIGWAVSKYEIYMATNFGPFLKVGETNSTTTTFTQYGQIPGDSLTFFVRAIRASGGASSSSNTFGHRSATKPIPQYCYLRCADVLDDGKIKLTWHPDLSGEIKKFNVFRSTDGVNYFFIDSTNNDLTSEKSYTDVSTSKDEGPYYFKINAYDLCDSVVLTSNTVKTLYIHSVSVGTSTIQSNWNSYNGFLNPILKYKIQRGVSSIGAITWEDLTDTGDTLLFDTELPDDVGEDGICYRAIAFENGPNLFGFSDSCHSNPSCAKQPIIAFFPNAFVPTGENTHFKPVCSFINFKTSFMVVYNRWGQEVARVTDLNQGWDGKKGGEILPEGIYFYMATLYGTLNGATKMYAGQVYLFNSE